MVVNGKGAGSVILIERGGGTTRFHAARNLWDLCTTVQVNVYDELALVVELPSDGTDRRRQVVWTLPGSTRTVHSVLVEEGRDGAGEHRSEVHLEDAELIRGCLVHLRETAGANPETSTCRVSMPPPSFVAWLRRLWLAAAAQIVSSNTPKAGSEKEKPSPGSLALQSHPVLALAEHLEVDPRAPRPLVPLNVALGEWLAGRTWEWLAEADTAVKHPILDRAWLAWAPPALVGWGFWVTVTNETASLASLTEYLGAVETHKLHEIVQRAFSRRISDTRIVDPSQG